MNKNYLQNIRNIKQSQPQPVEQAPQQRLQTIADVSSEQQADAGSGWPKQSVYDINFEEFFRASSESTNEAIRQTMSQLRALDQAEAAAAA